MIEIAVIRHPETEANVTRRWVGRGNSPFTELGLVQVDSIVAEIVAYAPEVVFASPLERTRIPAQTAAEKLGVDLVLDDRLIELDFGEAEGLTSEEALAAGIPLEFKAEDHPVAPGGESRRDILSRSAEVLDAITADHSRAAVVTHGGVFRSALVSLMNLPIDAIWSFHIKNAQVAKFSIGDDWSMLEEFYQATDFRL